MGLARLLRRRNRSEGIDQKLAIFVTSAEELAEQVFEFSTLVGGKMPDRSEVEMLTKALAAKTMEAAVQASRAKGTSSAEIDAYVSVVSARFQLAFQDRWAVMEQRCIRPVTPYTDTIN